MIVPLVRVRSLCVSVRLGVVSDLAVDILYDTLLISRTIRGILHPNAEPFHNTLTKGQPAHQPSSETDTPAESRAHEREKSYRRCREVAGPYLYYTTNRSRTTYSIKSTGHDFYFRYPYHQTQNTLKEYADDVYCV